MDTRATINSWSSGIGSFFSQRASRLSLPRTGVGVALPTNDGDPTKPLTDPTTVLPAHDTQTKLQVIDESTDLQKPAARSTEVEVEEDVENHSMPPSSLSTDSFVNPGTAL